MPPANMPNWQAESIRVTAFWTQSISQANIDEWWSMATNGVPPEQITSKPALNLFTADGPYEGGRLVLASSPGRIDWQFLFQPSEENLGITGDLGPYIDAHQRFVPRLRPWFVSLPEITRLAYGSVLREYVVDRLAGYERLQTYLPTVVLNGETSSDFQYQINRFRTSNEVPNLRINRLSKWSVNVLKQARLVFPSGQAQLVFQSGGLNTPDELHYCRLEMDLNTDGASTVDLSPNVESLVTEMTAMAQEIAEGGDRP